MGYELEFDETFDRDFLDPERWFPYYLPHWSNRDLAAARYDVGGGALRLRIDEDQQPWCPEFDGDVRVSALQTGAFAGPVGSDRGQHHFKPGLVVRKSQPELALYTPLYGRIELRARVSDDPTTMAALWMIGFEDEPERSAEICVCEILGSEVGANETLVGVGVHPFGDPSVTDDFAKVPVEIDAREDHVYAAEWTREGIRFLVDDDEIKVVDQSPAYPMQLMLTLYEFRPPADEAAPATYPKELVVEYVRGYRLAG